MAMRWRRRELPTLRDLKSLDSLMGVAILGLRRGCCGWIGVRRRDCEVMEVSTVER